MTSPELHRVHIGWFSDFSQSHLGSIHFNIIVNSICINSLVKAKVPRVNHRSSITICIDSKAIGVHMQPVRRRKSFSNSCWNGYIYVKHSIDERHLAEFVISNAIFNKPQA
ncbi:hypothetical protein TNCV_2093171 [Trichonephila clavipes]|nr:hypothetical protein TNCV_2093171 [Trichonephila clavipes]